MARPVWHGVLTFGLVTLPVRMYSATDSHTIRFHQLQRGTADRIRIKRINERTGKEVSADDIVKGLDIGDEYVVVEPDELDEIAPGRSKALEITEFVDLEEVEPVFFDQTYYLGPAGKEYGKVYTLLHRALTDSNKAGIATFVMRNREYLVAVKAEDEVLALHTLHWADEVRDPHSEVRDLPGKTSVAKKEVQTATQLIDALTAHWSPEDFHDEYQERVRRLVEAKSKGESVAKGEAPPESTNVVDLMSVLQESVESARSRGVKSGPSKEKGRKKDKKSDLESLTKSELYERATEAGIRGRSSMSREELIASLAGRARHGRRKAA
jgi:DNA end-binding protein Ku